MDKMKGINPGDRVRVTFEGEVEFCRNGAVNVKVDAGDPLSSSFTTPDTQSPHFRIERIEKPLAVGDRVRGVTSGDAGEIIWMNDTYVVIVGASHQHPLVKHIANVERIS